MQIQQRMACYEKKSKVKSAFKKAAKAVDCSMAVIAYAGFISVIYYKAFKGQFKDAKIHKKKRNK